MAAWLLLTFFISLHNQLSSVSSIITYEYRCLKNFIHQLKMNDCSFQQVLLQKLGWLLSWHWKTLFLIEVSFSSQRKEHRFFWKMVVGIFTIGLRFWDRHVFIWQSMKILNDFNTLTLKQIFWKTKTFFKKLEYYFLVESTKIENASFPYKTTISESNVKTNRMVNTK